MKYQVHSGYATYHGANIPIVEIKDKGYFVFSRQIAELGGYSQKESIYRILTEREHSLSVDKHYIICAASHFNKRDFISSSPYVVNVLDTVQNVALLNVENLHDICLHTMKDGVRLVVREVTAGFKVLKIALSQVALTKSCRRFVNIVSLEPVQTGTKGSGDKALAELVAEHGAQELLEVLTPNFCGKLWGDVRMLLTRNAYTSRLLSEREDGEVSQEDPQVILVVHDLSPETPTETDEDPQEEVVVEEEFWDFVEKSPDKGEVVDVDLLDVHYALGQKIEEIRAEMMSRQVKVNDLRSRLAKVMAKVQEVEATMQEHLDFIASGGEKISRLEASRNMLVSR